MADLLPASRDIHAIKVTEIPDGDGFRKITLEWTDAAGERHEHPFFGYSASKVHADLAACTALSEATRRGYLMGLIRGKTTG